MHCRRDKVRRFALGTTLATSFLIASVARAEAKWRVELRYTHDPKIATCPVEDDLRSIVAARLGYDPFATSAKEALVVRIDRGSRGLVGRVELRDANGALRGAREIRSPSRDCRELVASLSVAAAIAIDPMHELLATSKPPSAEPLAPPAPPPAALSESEPLASPPATKAPLPPTPPSLFEFEAAAPPRVEAPLPVATGAKKPLAFRGHIGSLMSLGSAKIAAPGLEVGLGVRSSAFSLGIDGRIDFPGSVEVQGGRITTALTLASVVPCIHYAWAAGCAIAAAGAYRAHGDGVTDPAHVVKPYSAAGGRIVIEVPMTRSLAVRLHADLLATLTRTTFRLDYRDVWTTPGQTGAVGLGIVGTL